MPYIDPERRVELMSQASIPDMVGPGELNYFLTMVAKEYLFSQDEINYQAYNDVVGALESAKLEFYRRTVAAYENNKIDMNGDVY